MLIFLGRNSRFDDAIYRARREACLIAASFIASIEMHDFRFHNFVETQTSLLNEYQDDE